MLAVPAIVPGWWLLLSSIQLTVDPRGTVSGVAGNTVVVSSDPPLTINTDNDGPLDKNGEPANWKGDGPIGLLPRSHPSVSVRRTATHVRRKAIEILLRACRGSANELPQLASRRDREWYRTSQAS
jgi:hypothetical protein